MTGLPYFNFKKTNKKKIVCGRRCQQQPEVETLTTAASNVANGNQLYFFESAILFFLFLIISLHDT